MKNLINFIIILLFPLVTFSQISSTELKSETYDSDEMQFLSKKGGSHGIYFGLGGGFAHLDQYDFAILSSRIAYVADQKFEFGIGWEFFHSYKGFQSVDSELINYVSGGLGGVHFKAIIRGKDKIHFAIPLFIGAGATGIAYEDKQNIFENFDPEYDDWAPIFFFEPGANVEININRIVGFEMGVKYRFATNAEPNNFPFNDLSGLKIEAMFKIGVFGFGQKTKNKKPDFESISDPNFIDLD